ncbi:50S ribosomal protein L21 [Corynebacterium sp. TAE3-ERU12]|uniref:50S ribosomal protein L21 n=1 Tax=Corynebacterium sp. TAE3-ERU12 TaxID=2849491 RepID=UPI001C461197|nr:50S ribosomal protein L21 [Corynebacterium sp. TAE3-ERU12]MBV7294975.1 50S ribosomal protein L21 [Corynebacterium sp. TAE3-ERU12]
MYAIVKTGGKQYKVAEGDLVKVEKIEGDAGTAVDLTPVLLVDGANVISGDDLSKVTVKAEINEQTKGQKIRGMHYKNKTGYKRRWGHRQQLTELKITEVKA